MFGLAFYVRARMAAHAALRARGFGLGQIRQMISAASEDAIDLAAAEAGVAPPPNLMGALGDGSIIQAIIDFLKSDQGKALIAALIQILLLALGGL